MRARPQIVLVLLACSIYLLPGLKASATGTPTFPGIPTQVISPTPSATPEPSGPKKNTRPATKMAPEGAEVKTPTAPEYLFIFDRPGFLTSRIEIKHDSEGRGEITFTKQDLSEPITEQIELSATTMSAIAAAYDRLDFLNSNEPYQFRNQMPQMGSNTLKLARAGRSRTVSFNWTEQPDAKLLMDEYRRIGNEYVWKFDMTVSRGNRPLDAPRLLDALDSYLGRGEISDPPHLLAFLTTLASDERIPLIARNHTLRLIKQIMKGAKSP